jgi:hypothetical protein
MGNQQRSQVSVPIIVRLIIISAALGAMAVLGADLIARVQSPGHQAAAVLTSSYLRARTPDSEAAEDEALTNSAEDAGYRWAERRNLDQAGECPAWSPDFHRGCIDYVGEQQTRDDPPTRGHVDGPR